jgi:hypothetical protein
MKTVKIKIGDHDIKELEKIFENESNFQPRCKEDYLIHNLLKQIVANPKVAEEA